LVFDRDETMRWRAIEALGDLCAAQDDLERVRGIIRRFFWLMNDESGGIAWHGPEAVGEILARVPALIPEYGQIVASFTAEPPFGPGAAWAVARAAPLLPERFAHAVKDLQALVSDEDAFGRAYALRALALLKPRLAQRAAHDLVNDDSTFTDYDRSSGELRTRRVADIARSIAQNNEAAA
jgi:HEAT repeat protein